MVVDSFFLKHSHCIPVCLTSVLITWLGNNQFKDPKILAGRKCGLHSRCSQGPTTVVSFQGNYLSLSFSLFVIFGIAVELGGVVSFAPFGTPLALWACSVFMTQEYVLFIQQKTIRYSKDFFLIVC